MNIFQQDPQTLAAAVIQRILQRRGEYLVYCKEDGVIRMEPKDKPTLRSVNDGDIVGCYTRNSDPGDIAEDLGERLKEVAQIREIMR